MRKIGGYLTMFGIGSILLNLIGYEFIVMMWIDFWGTGVGWIIRLAMVGIGGALLMVAPAADAE